MNWLEQIRNLLPHQLAVEHQPETPRYSRARSKLRHIVNRGTYLGKREQKERTLEIAVWTPPEHGRGTGYYCCFRVYFKDDELLCAVLFASMMEPKNLPASVLLNLLLPLQNQKISMEITMKTLIKKKYPYQAAGRTWIIPEFHLSKLPDGTIAILESEINRIHYAIANEICGNKEGLTKEELEFLCDITQTSFSEIADYLGIHRSTLTKWRTTGQIPKNVMGLVLKKWFWFKLFGQKLGQRKIPIAQLRDEVRFLSFAKAEAIEKNLAEHVEIMQA